MPLVRSYYRRAAGTASLAPAMNRSRMDVAIYDGAGENLLRDRSGGRYRLGSLAFSSGLPGGFLNASFRLERPAARIWPGRAGLRTIIRRGERVLWWGWIEDLNRIYRGNVETIDAACFGPWQQVQQRLFSPAYTGTVYGDTAIANELRTYCDQISTDYSQLEATGVDIAALTWSNQPIADLVKLVCDAGNSAGAPMLFAILAPTYRGINGYPASMLANSNIETGSPANWVFSQTTGDPAGTWTTAIFNSPGHALKVDRGTVAGTQAGKWSQSNVVCSASTSYVFDYWGYFGAVAGIQIYLQVLWYDAGSGYLSTSATTVRTSGGTAGGQRYVEALASPAGTASCTVRCVASLPDSGANAYAVFDDVYMYLAGSAPARDEKPRARLWARDLSEYDYLLYTADLAAGLGVDTSTRTLANAVLASYGSGPSYTAVAQDSASQAAYRRRDAVVGAGDVALGTAEAVRDAYLALYADPATEARSFRIDRPGAVRTAHGGLIHPEDLQAGDRLRVMDGPEAGLTLLLERVAYQDGVVTCTPEQAADVGLLLAGGN